MKNNYFDKIRLPKAPPKKTIESDKDKDRRPDRKQKHKKKFKSFKEFLDGND
jgi:hypothetical protein